MSPHGPEEAPKVTITGTSTVVGLLPETVLDRFSVKLVLVMYTSDEGAEIAPVVSHKIFTGLALPSETTCYALAAAANNNLRLIRGLLETWLTSCSSRSLAMMMATTTTCPSCLTMPASPTTGLTRLPSATWSSSPRNGAGLPLAAEPSRSAA